jgi:arsenite/tail-anchored protein-transporting ATPase
LTYLNLYGYSTDMVITNRVLPDDAQGDYFDTWRENQSRYMQIIGEMFTPLPILHAPMFEQEVVGLGMLRRMADAIYKDGDPTDIYYRGRTQEVIKKDDTYILQLPLALAEKADIQMTRSGDDLIVHIGNQKRSLLLPRALAGLDILGATYEDNTLSVSFGSGGDADA